MLGLSTKIGGAVGPAPELKLSVTEPPSAPACEVSRPTLRSLVSVAPGARPVTEPAAVASPLAFSVTLRAAAPVAAVLVTLTFCCSTAPTWALGNTIVLGVLTRGAAAGTMRSTIFSVIGASAAA